MLRLKALDHVGLKVTDMDRTLDFYQRLGLTLLRTSGPNADGLRSAVLQVGSQELLPHPQVLAHPHICFDENVEAGAERLQRGSSG